MELVRPPGQSRPVLHRRAIPQSAPAPNDAEEFVNALTHGIGCLLSIVGAGLLLQSAATCCSPLLFAGCAVYAMTLTGLYAASTLSHVARDPQRKRRLRMWDQAFIYLLIAGSYTPYGLAYLETGWWRLMWGVMWGGAVTGAVLKVGLAHRVDVVSVASYLVLAWIPVLSLPRLISVAPPGCVGWVLAGGVCYTTGTLFLVLDRRFPYFHAVWHVLVMAGSVCHFLGVLLYIAV
jgi:hemolysin III